MFSFSSPNSPNLGTWAICIGNYDEQVDGMRFSDIFFQVASGNLTVCYWKWPFIYSGFSRKRWFSIVMLVYQRVANPCDDCATDWIRSLLQVKNPPRTAGGGNTFRPRASNWEIFMPLSFGQISKTFEIRLNILEYIEMVRCRRCN